ncbi:MAG: helix-turn-helix domain-containing protein, partial [Candidatus Omnitrophota bacterium]
MIVYTYSWGDLLMDFSFKLRSMIFSDWMRDVETVKDICKRYGLSRKCFYKFKKRFDKDGFEGLRKTADNSVDFFCNHMMANCPEGKIKRVLTDQGVEFYCAQHKDVDGYFTVCLLHCDVRHTVAKFQHPWTNGYAE